METIAAIEGPERVPLALRLDPTGTSANPDRDPARIALVAILPICWLRTIRDRQSDCALPLRRRQTGGSTKYLLGTDQLGDVLAADFGARCR
jgi:hypothetical protein